MPPPLSGGAGSVAGGSVAGGRVVGGSVVGGSVGGGGGSVGGGGGGVVVVRNDNPALALARSATDALCRRATRDEGDSAAASTVSCPPSGTTALARITGPTSRARPAAPPITARRTAARLAESSVLGGWSVRCAIGGVLLPARAYGPWASRGSATRGAPARAVLCGWCKESVTIAMFSQR